MKKTGLDIEFYDAIMKNIDDNNSYTEEMAKRIDFKELEESFNKFTLQAPVAFLF